MSRRKQYAPVVQQPKQVYADGGLIVLDGGSSVWVEHVDHPGVALYKKLYTPGIIFGFTLAMQRVYGFVDGYVYREEFN